MMTMTYSKGQVIALVSLRIVTGWHFLYEGLAKIVQEDWTARAYLMDSKGFLAGFFNGITANPALLSVADFLNEWGLTFIGLSLILGLFTRISSLSGILLLAFYYLSHPSWPGFEYLFPSEGVYFIVNKNMVEIFGLLVICFFPTSHIIGIKRLIMKWKGVNGVNSHS
ncbi:MAG TPA: DoxX family protein [Bacteroidales bacterium]|nr:DoxX family protein [Bacteroidales bacterium]HNS46584.1 DoxX family protein [Bacteroidales bacterium]